MNKKDNRFEAPRKTSVEYQQASQEEITDSSLLQFIVQILQSKNGFHVVQLEKRNVEHVLYTSTSVQKCNEFIDAVIEKINGLLYKVIYHNTDSRSRCIIYQPKDWESMNFLYGLED